MPTFNEKEAAILGSLVKHASTSQRELSRSTGISLGLINLILRKFIKTGYIQVSRLNKKKVDYLLTAEGMSYAAKKTYHYANNTIRRFQQIRMNLTTLLDDLFVSGYRYYSVHGDGELRDLIQSTFDQVLGAKSAVLGKEHREDDGSVVLEAGTDPIDPSFKGKVVNVLEKIRI